MQNLPALDKLTGLTSLNLNLGISQVQNLPALDKLTSLTSLTLDLGNSQVQNLPTLDKLTGLSSLTIFLAESQIQSLFALKGLENMKDLRMVVPPRLLASFPDDVKLRAATKLTLDMTRSAAGPYPVCPFPKLDLFRKVGKELI